MSRKRVYLAIDLGASSGRVMAGEFDGRKLALAEVHRFPNRGYQVLGHYHWDILALFEEIKAGLRKAATRYGAAVASAGVDTWGVDYGLVDGAGSLLGLPYQYRDSRTAGMDERVFRRIPRETIYRTTGIQFMFFNTIWQLAAELEQRPAALAAAERILFTPDLLHYWLTGRATNEYTIASTSQLVDAKKRSWSKPLLRKLGVPGRLFGDLVEPGTVIGPLLSGVREETGLGRIKIVAPGSHDTASAVAAVPATGDDHVYLSSGTWSLMGVERASPLINRDALAMNFTNEGGVCGTIRLLKNITGLWLLQECRRNWALKGRELDYRQIAQLAREAKPFLSIVDPDDPSFSTPGDMPARVRAFCKRTRQAIPRDEGQMARILYESLALRYRDVFAKIEKLTGRAYKTLHIVGGGAQNTFLNQLAADAVQRPVVAGPEEATAIGNVIMQMIAARDLKSLAEGRELVRRSFACKIYEPREAAAWAAASARFEKVAG